MSILKSINPANEQMFAEFKQMSLTKVKQIILESSRRKINGPNLIFKIEFK